MQKLLLLYQGPATPPDASHEGWPQWFNQLGDNLVDKGLPMAHGRSLRGDALSHRRLDRATTAGGHSVWTHAEVPHSRS